jgi:4-amino-4-deoxy-L-arabinose transferase-like glycosyltransferase
LLYFSLGQHLSAGYASVPPFTGFIAWLMIHTLGYSLFSARIIPIVLGGIFIILGAAITRELKGKAYAQILVAIAITVTPFNLRGFSLFQPVCFDVFFWSLIFWLTLKWINTKADKYLLLLGLIAGLGMLNKYLIALEILGLLIAFVFSPYRNIFTRKAFYLALLIALVVFLPNIIWQINYHLPVLIHMKALNDNQLVHVDRIAFFTDQIFIGSMAIVLIIPGIIFMCFDKSMKPYRPLILASLIVLLILAILRGKSYYTAGLFLLWIAAGGIYWENKLKRLFARILLPLLMLLITLPILPMGIPVYKPDRLAQYFAAVKNKYGFDMVLRWETGQVHSLPQDYADMLGWDELAAITAKAYNQVQDKQ